jgi:hypothetical protein
LKVIEEQSPSSQRKEMVKNARARAIVSLLTAAIPKKLKRISSVWK